MAIPDSLADLAENVTRVLRTAGDMSARVNEALGVVADGFAAQTATAHRLGEDGLLQLVAFRGLPGKVLAVTQRIPVGKGMAGLCAQRRESVTVCNLQTDDSGTAKPGAKETRVRGGLVVPAFVGDQFVGALGVGKVAEHEYTPAEVFVLEDCAGRLAAALIRSRPLG